MKPLMTDAEIAAYVAEHAGAHEPVPEAHLRTIVEECSRRAGGGVEGRKPVYLCCDPCGHRWIVAYLPMDMGKFARVVKGACCPMCGERKEVFLSSEATS